MSSSYLLVDIFSLYSLNLRTATTILNYMLIQMWD